MISVSGNQRILLTLLGLLGLACFLGCSAADSRSDRSAPPGPDNTLRVGISGTAPPIIFQEDGKPAGLEADLARELARALGKQVQFVPIFWPNLILELRDRRIDIIMAGMSVTDARKGRVAFADPYLIVGQKALIRAKDRATLGTADGVRATSRRVGVETGSTGEQYAKRHLPNAETFALPTLTAAVDALVAGQIDMVIYDSPSVQWIVNQRRDDDLFAVPGLLTTESLAWAVNKNDAELLGQVNRVLADWRTSGKLAQITARWLSETQ